MDKQQLELKLENFKQACVKAGSINTDNNALELEESYPGMKPTSFIINLTVKKEWLDGKYHGYALKELIKLLYENADEEALKNILTLRIYGDDESHSLELSQPKESA